MGKIKRKWDPDRGSDIGNGKTGWVWESLGGNRSESPQQAQVLTLLIIYMGARAQSLGDGVDGIDDEVPFQNVWRVSPF